MARLSQHPRQRKHNKVNISRRIKTKMVGEMPCDYRRSRRPKEARTTLDEMKHRKNVNLIFLIDKREYNNIGLH